MSKFKGYKFDGTCQECGEQLRKTALSGKVFCHKCNEYKTGDGEGLDAFEKRMDKTMQTM